MLRPKLEDLGCLNTWPEGTTEYEHAQQLIAELYALAEKHGSKQVAQLAGAMDEIWVNPRRLQHFQTLREAHFGA